MGAILAKFRKEKSTVEILEKLENEIKEIEEYSISTQARQKRYVGNFLLISIGFYITSCIIFFFIFFPPTWKDRIIYLIPLLIFPLLIFLLKRLVAWYFQRKLNKNQTKFNALKSEKRKVLEKVMEKETYKIAIEILNRFGDKNKNFKPTGAITPRVENSPIITKSSPGSNYQHNLMYPSQQSQQLMQRFSALETSKPLSSSLEANKTPVLTTTPKSSNIGYQRTQNTSIQNFQSPVSSSTLVLKHKRTPFPVINQQNKTVAEKMVDYLIGDGPQNRFAMICKECYGHNGMAFQEDYEYSAFRCAFCSTLNSAKKSRPVAPKLITSPSPSGIDALKHSDSSTSTSERNTDSEDENFQSKSKSPPTAAVIPTTILPKLSAVFDKEIEKNDELIEEKESINNLLEGHEKTFIDKKLE